MKISRPLITAALLFIASNGHPRELLDQVVAIVDEDVITQVELEQRTRDIRQQLAKPVVSAADMASLRKQVLEKMIRDTIQLQLADKIGIKINDVELNRTLERLASANNIQLPELRERLESEGVSFERFREQTRSELIMKQLQQRLVANRVNVSDQEVDQFIEESQKKDQSKTRYRLRHILIDTPSSARPEEIQQAKARAEQVYQRIVAGDDFADLAIQESAGRNALQGGDLGWRAANELPESFVTALRDIEVGRSTLPVRSASGFHLLYLVDTSVEGSTVIQTRARHILINDSDSEDVSAQLSVIRQRILDGEGFAAMAKEYSEDPGSRDSGGDLGWADPGTFVAGFESVMQTLDDGEISAPFRSQFGWHVMQVLERRENTASRDALASEARKQIRARKVEEELRLWLRKIRDEAFVEVLGENPAGD